MSETNKLTISVAIATYNGQKYLREQLISINNQDMLPDEIVISDDNSTDETIEIVKEFKQISKVPIKFIENNKDTSGVIYNFLNAFKNCTSDYICYCDQDDFWEMNKISTLVNTFKNQPNVKLIIHKSKSVNGSLEDLGIIQPNFIDTKLIEFPSYCDDFWGFGHQMTFHRDVLDIIEVISKKELDLEGVSDCFDRSIIVAAGMVGDILLLNKVLMLFRRHESSLTTAGKFKNGLKDKAKGNEVFIKNTVEQLDKIKLYLSSIDQNSFKKIYMPDEMKYLKMIMHKKVTYEQLNRLYQSENFIHLIKSIFTFKWVLFRQKKNYLIKNLIYVFVLFFNCNRT